MSKYTLQVEQRVHFDDETSCFNAMLQAMDAILESDCVMTGIKRNQYCFENPKNGKEVTITILKGKSK